jgi:hypothetical protein
MREGPDLTNSRFVAHTTTVSLQEFERKGQTGAMPTLAVGMKTTENMPTASVGMAPNVIG